MDVMDVTLECGNRGRKRKRKQMPNKWMSKRNEHGASLRHCSDVLQDLQVRLVGNRHLSFNPIQLVDEEDLSKCTESNKRTEESAISPNLAAILQRVDELYTPCISASSPATNACCKEQTIFHPPQKPSEKPHEPILNMRKRLKTLQDNMKTQSNFGSKFGQRKLRIFCEDSRGSSMNKSRKRRFEPFGIGERLPLATGSICSTQCNKSLLERFLDDSIALRSELEQTAIVHSPVNLDGIFDSVQNSRSAAKCPKTKRTQVSSFGEQQKLLERICSSLDDCIETQKQLKEARSESPHNVQPTSFESEVQRPEIDDECVLEPSLVIDLSMNPA